jgi:hypothetical protein
MVIAGLPVILRPIYVLINSIVALMLSVSSSYIVIIVATIIVTSCLT